MSEFDAYLMVDWSASSTPKRGKDSIWYCLQTRGDGLDAPECTNPATRHDACEGVREILVRNVAQGLRTLVGFDFPYAYPHCFAKLSGLRCHPPWNAVWKELQERIVDDERNRNNRGKVAAKLNEKVSGESFPFWGNGLKEGIPNLPKKRTHWKSGEYASLGLSEKRIVEQRCKAHSAWKLFGAGSVGGQALLGIPYLQKLRGEPTLSTVSQVWPFETGFKLPARSSGGSPVILHAEIYPSIVPATPVPGEVKDQTQVRTLARYFAEKDESGALPELFAGPSDLTCDQRTIVKSEEGWILGVK